MGKVPSAHKLEAGQGGWCRSPAYLLGESKAEPCLIVDLAVTLKLRAQGRIYFPFFLSNYQDLLSPLQESLLFLWVVYLPAREVDVSAMI